MHRPVILTVVIMLILPGCRSRQDAGTSDSAADAATVAVADTAAMPGAAGMASGKVESDIVKSMEVHMRVMDTAGTATIQARMPRHHQLADGVISHMNDDVRRLNIATDSIWTATLDSVRQDLSRMRAMTDSDMTAMMPAHLARMRWLIQMHWTMTGKTPP